MIDRVSAPAMIDTPMLEHDDEQPQAEEAVDDRRHARQVDDREPDDPGEEIVLRVFVQVDRGHDARPAG